MLRGDRYFSSNPSQKALALHIYDSVKDAPIISPHGHADPALFSQSDYHFQNPAALLFQSDHYILRMLYSQGVAYEELLSQEDPYHAWEIFANTFYLFHGTPSGLWITHELELVFGVTEKLNHYSAKSIYRQIEACLASEDFTPRNLFKQFNIEVLATTDSATDPLTHHKAIRHSGWDGRIIPTFRPDELIHLTNKNWSERIKDLSEITGQSIQRFSDFISALEQRRENFKEMGATALDIGVASPRTARLSSSEINRIFDSALKGEVHTQDAEAFTAHMLYEMARMSCEDGLVMQIHPGIFRNHNPLVYHRFGADMGFDIPLATEFTVNLQEMLSDFGNHPNFRLIIFTGDESTYSRELAPLAGAYPSVVLGPPWWFLDSWGGMMRYFDTVIETAGFYNTAGFNDDTRAFLSIPARHDVWRRASANWLAGLCARGLIDEDDAEEMVFELAVGRAKAAYNL